MRSHRLHGVLVLFTLAWLGVSAPAYAWWGDDWDYRKEISFDLSKAGADITDSASDVPVLIRLSLGNFGYFNDTRPDGGDLRFVAADDKTPLKYHLERYDVQAQMAFVWVKVPRLTGGAATDKIYLYYGNKNAAAGADVGGTYDVNQALVYHFGAPGDKLQDSSSYKTEPKTFAAEVNPASLIGAGAKLNGTDTISIPATSALHLVPKQGLTISAWVRTDGAQRQAYIAALAEGGKAFVLGLDGLQPFARWSSGAGAPVVATSNAPIDAGQWHHLAARIGGGHLDVIIDGAETASANAEAVDVGGMLTIGGAAAGTNGFAGELDELQVSNIARPNAWLRAAAVSQGMVAPLIVYGGDAQKEGSGGSQSYIGTTLRSVTVDGWVIISILAVMFVVSVAVMGGKAIYLSRVVKGNSKFLTEFHSLGLDPSVLERREGQGPDEETGASYGISTLWLLYHHGMRETMKRLEGQAAGAARSTALSAQSIEAIRATLDATLTRMLQRLNQQMVLLTIAIAGGPFLGLLGTVLGVMITFAAIAASGDVNINAIAPGTAAALVATVAGLAVAIPCLFGYNFLNTRIKEIGADMRVFVDEFVANIAETYS